MTRLMGPLLLMMLSIVGCESTESFENQGPYQEIQLKESSLEDKIPSSAVNQIIEKFELSKNKKLNAKNFRGILKRSSFEIFLNSDLKNFNSGKNLKMHSERGSSSVDFREYLRDYVDGEARIGLKFPVKPEKILIYYMSEAKRVKKRGVNLGAGCGQFLDITSTASEFMEGDGAQMSLSDLQYVSVYSGTYYFFLKLGDQIYLSRFQLVDSRYPDLICGV